MPVTSADNERANGTLKLVKGYLRTTMTTERLFGLALMNIHYDKPVKYDAVVQLFAERYPRRLLMSIPSLTKHKIEIRLHDAVYFHLCYISIKKNGIFTLKNYIVKHADFASEWRKSRFRGLEI